MKTIRDVNVSNKRVLVRCDFDVPLDSSGEILNDFRIKKILPTIKYLIENNSRIILMGHLARPEGKVVPGLRLDKVCSRLSELLNISVKKTDDCIGDDVKKDVDQLKAGQVLLLENLRFHKEEQENNSEFAKELSELADLYINEAFSVCHRPHASVIGVPKYLPSAMGLFLEEEIKNLTKVLENPEKPMVALIGGKKVEDKIKVINKISKKANYVIISGLIKKEAEENKIKFDYPEKITAPLDSLGALDIDEKTIELFTNKIKNAKTILWNGPFGKTEDEAYVRGTLEIAKAIIESKAFSVIGGGETVEFLDRKNLLSKFSHVSTGGGAMLSYLAGEKLPGIEALKQE